jgi:hypothetical protein
VSYRALSKRLEVIVSCTVPSLNAELRKRHAKSDLVCRHVLIKCRCNNVTCLLVVLKGNKSIQFRRTYWTRSVK